MLTLRPTPWCAANHLLFRGKRRATRLVCGGVLAPPWPSHTHTHTHTHHCCLVRALPPSLGASPVRQRARPARAASKQTFVLFGSVHPRVSFASAPTKACLHPCSLRTFVVNSASVADNGPRLDCFAVGSSLSRHRGGSFIPGCLAGFFLGWSCCAGAGMWGSCSARTP